MKFLIIVNESPWASGLALAANRFVRAAVAADISVPVVFFRGEGVYNALAGELSDAGTPDLHSSWTDLAAVCGARLLLCSSSRLRRFPDKVVLPFEHSGLTEMVELMLDADRVVSF